MNYLSDNGVKTYKLCRCAFRTPPFPPIAHVTQSGAIFEIADLYFWRGPTYTASFEFLESRGDFYYEVSRPFLSSPAPLFDGFFLAPTAVGRCACTFDCRDPIWRKGPDPLFAQDGVRACPVHSVLQRRTFGAARGAVRAIPPRTLLCPCPLSLF